MANKKKETNNNSIKQEIYRIIKLLLIVLVFFSIFYMFTVYLINREEKTPVSNSTNEDINYNEVLAGSSFDLEDKEYIVIYYDTSDKDLKSKMNTLISNYNSKKSTNPIYVVDMNSKFNKKYIGPGNDVLPTSIDDLSINGPTLIEFNNKKVVNYITSYDNIKKYLD